jgi:hypothetical protein
MSQYDTGLNTAPEHGETPFGAVGDGGPISATTPGTRPPVPNDPIGTVTDSGPESMQPYTDPGDPDNDMDSETVDDLGL